MRKVASPALALAAALAVGSPGCGGAGTEGPAGPSTVPTQFAAFTSAHFVFHHTGLDSANVATIAQSVESHHARITADLGVSSMPVVAVYLHPDRRSLQEAVQPLVGTLPSFATGLVTGVDRIHIVSPNAAPVWPYEQALQAVVHEFAHCVSLRLNPSFGNNPRWLWESVALYEAGQLVNPRGLPYMVAGQPPSLAELDRLSDTRIYDVGYLIGEFVVETRGREALVELVRANGDIARVLGLDAAAFSSQWHAFVRARYGI
jgi:hypothetical protein